MNTFKSVVCEVQKKYIKQNYEIERTRTNNKRENKQ